MSGIATSSACIPARLSSGVSSPLASRCHAPRHDERAVSALAPTGTAQVPGPDGRRSLSVR
eukprot:1400503-Prymnesium_polylepis.2